MVGRSAIIFLAVSLLASRAAAAAYPVEVDNDSAVAFVKDQRGMVLFYAPWCKDSQKFYPVFVDFAKKNSRRLRSATFDCVEHVNDLCVAFEAGWYPKAILFKDNRQLTYSGDNTVEDLEDFVFRRAPLVWDTESVESEPLHAEPRL